jgi:hypothetical protein
MGFDTLRRGRPRETQHAPTVLLPARPSRLERGEGRLGRQSAGAFEQSPRAWSQHEYEDQSSLHSSGLLLNTGAKLRSSEVDRALSANPGLGGPALRPPCRLQVHSAAHSRVTPGNVRTRAGTWAKAERPQPARPSRAKAPTAQGGANRDLDPCCRGALVYPRAAVSPPQRALRDLASQDLRPFGNLAQAPFAH